MERLRQSNSAKLGWMQISILKTNGGNRTNQGRVSSLKIHRNFIEINRWSQRNGRRRGWTGWRNNGIDE